MLNDRVRVVIATTQGPVDVDAIRDIDAGEASIVALGSTAQVISGLMSSYRAFVAKGSGVIARSFGHDAFRLELSSEIHAGDSWQLAVFLAHALHKHGRLAEADEPASTIVWATGQVDYQLRIAEIGHIPEKISESLTRFVAERELGATVHAVWPRANGADADEKLRERLSRLGVAIHEADQVGEILAALGVAWVEAAGPRAPEWEGSPYRGLAPFGEAERTIFFGRGRAREEALARLRTAAAQGVGFLLIHGGSGAGKSSLARAGLIGDIVADADEADAWRASVLPPVQPDRPPLRALAQALATVLPELIPEEDDREDRLIGLMRDDSGELVARIVSILTPSSGRRRAKLVLVVDQLEDVLTYAHEGAAPSGPERTFERDCFALVIERLARSEVAWILATLRSDLLSRLEDSKPLSRLASDARLYRLERPNRAALRDMVQGPAQLAGLTFEGKDSSGTPLPEILIEAAARSPDSLPLLQFGLDRLYDLRDRKSGAITVQAYYRIGGLEGAIGRYAEELTITAFGEDPVMIRAVEDVILALARPNEEEGKLARLDEGGAVVARTLALDAGFETAPRERAMEAMARARLVTLDTTATGVRNLRVTHEALLTNWPRAQRLLKDRSSALELRERLEGEARAWEGRGSDPSYLLQSGRALSAAEDLVEEGRVALSERVRGFVAASSEAARAAAESELRRLQNEAQSERRRRQIAVMAAAGLLVLAGAAAWFWRDAGVERDEARRQAARAEHNLELATKTATSLVFDLAQKFRDSGLPQSLVKDIIDRARQLQDQLLEGGQSSADLSYGRASAVAMAGQTLWHVGDVDSALATTQEAQKLYEEGSQRYPDQQRWRQGLLVTYKDLGDALVEKGQHEQALEAFRHMLEIAKALVAVDPNDLDWLNDLAQSYDEVGNRLKRDGKLEEALEAFQSGMKVAKTLVAKDPRTLKWQMQMALADRLIGDTLNALNRPGEAMATAQEGVDLMRSLTSASPENTLFKSELVRHLHLMGDSQIALKHFDLAMAAYREELDISETLKSADEADIDRKRPVFDAHKAIGDLEAQMGHRDAALSAYRAALAVAKEIAVVGREAPDDLSILASIDRALGEQLMYAENYDEAEAALAESTTITETLTPQHPSNSGWLEDEANSQELYGDLMIARKKPKGAIEHYQKALEARTQLSVQLSADPAQKKQILVVARALAGAFEKDGQHDEATRTFEDGLTTARAFMAKDPGNDEWERQYADLTLDFGKLRLDRESYDLAIANLQDGLSHAKKIALRNPKSSSDLWLVSSFFENLGDVYRQSKKPGDAAAMYVEALKIETALVKKEPNTTNWSYGVLQSNYWLGSVLADQRQLDAALKADHDGLAAAQILVDLEPATSRWRWDKSLATERVAEDLHKLKQFDASLLSYQDARAQLEDLVAKDPSDSEKQLELCRLDGSLGDVFKDRDRLEQALEIYQKGAAVCRQLLEKDPTNAACARNAYSLAERIGDVLTRLGRMEDARTSYEAALALAKGLASSSSDKEAAAWDVFEAETNLGDALANLGRIEDAQAAYGEALAIVTVYEASSHDSGWRNAHSKAMRRIGYAHLQVGDVSGARTAFDEAVKLAPDNVNSRLARALAAIESGDNATAIADLNIAIKFDAGWPYFAIWLHVARQRAAQDDREALATYAATIDKSAWPAPVFAMFLGDMDPDQLIAAAAVPDDARKQNEQTCEAETYIGLIQLTKGAINEAKAQFETAMKDCPVDFTERQIVTIELSKLSH